MLPSEAIEEAISERCAAALAESQRAHRAAAAVTSGMNLLRYGGCALHAVLQGGVYDDADTPDIDVFTCRGGSSKKTAHAVAGMLRKEGVEGVRVLPALHRGTHSVRVGRQVLVDVTHVTPLEYRLLREAAKHERLHCGNTVPTLFLKMSMHMELSRPASYIERWRKIWPRLEALYAAYPLALNHPMPVKPGPPVDTVHLRDDVVSAAVQAGCVVVGRMAVAELTGVDTLTAWPHDFVLPEARDPSAVVDGICSALDMERSDLRDCGAHGAPYFMITTRDREYVARVFSIGTEVCTARAGGIEYGSSDLVLHLLYCEMLRMGAHTVDRQMLADAIDGIVRSQKVRGCRDGVHRRFGASRRPARP